MAKVKDVSGGQLRFKCPGCNSNHVVNITGAGNARWGFDGNYERPTLTPSVLVQVGHYIQGRESECWCDYNRGKSPEEICFECVRCHSFVRNGYIEFLSDCSHALAGKTVPLPDIES